MNLYKKILGLAVCAAVLAPVLFSENSPIASHAASDCLAAHIELQSVPSKKPVSTTLRLETAPTPEARERGLMYRETLAPCDGMAFFFPSLSPEKPRFTPQKFWMKNTPLPLDMLFVDALGRITFIATAKPHSLTPIGPDTPTMSVIEIDAGRAARENIRVGDKVSYELEVPPYTLAH